MFVWLCSLKQGLAASLINLLLYWQRELSQPAVRFDDSSLAKTVEVWMNFGMTNCRVVWDAVTTLMML